MLGAVEASMIGCVQGLFKWTELKVMLNICRLVHMCMNIQHHKQFQGSLSSYLGRKARMRVDFERSNISVRVSRAVGRAENASFLVGLLASTAISMNLEVTFSLP